MRRVDIVGTGFTVLDRVYEGSSRSFEALGGSCGNVLWSLARLQHKVAPILSLGADEVGRCLVEHFESVGADTSHIAQHQNQLSPVLIQFTDTVEGTHTFSFTCPETQEKLPRYLPVRSEDVAAATPVLETCLVFYTDRVSDAIVTAMEKAAEGGSIVYFEPSSDEEPDLFNRALACSSIVKFSSERFDRTLLMTLLDRDVIVIMTHGADGLEVRAHSQEIWCEAVEASAVKDTSGSGDMVSVGLINNLVREGRHRYDLPIETVVRGARAGQRLAAANCEFVGARGLFAHREIDFVQSLLHTAN